MRGESSIKGSGHSGIYGCSIGGRSGLAMFLLILTALMIISVLLKSDYVLQESLWPDEAQYLYIGRNLSSDPGNLTGIDGAPFYMSPPLLMYAVSVAARIPGIPLEHATRTFTLILSILMIPLVFLIGKKLFNPIVGILAAGLITFCPLSNWISVRVLTDGPVVFLVYLAILMLIYEKKSAFWILAALAILTKYSAFPIVFLPVLTRMKDKNWALLYASLFGLLCMFVLIKPLFGAPAGWPGYFWNFFQLPDLSEMFADTGYFMGIYLLILAVTGMYFAVQKKEFSPVFHWVCIFGVFRIFLPWMIFRMSRYSLPIYPALYIMAAFGVYSLSRVVSEKWPRYRLIPVIFFMVIAYPVIYDHTLKTSELLEQTSHTFIGYREAADFVSGQPGPLTLLTPSPRQMKYYAPSITVFDLQEDIPAESLSSFVEENDIGYLGIDLWSPHLPQWCLDYDFEMNGYELIYKSKLVFIFRT